MFAKGRSVLRRQSGRNALFSATSVLVNPILQLAATPFLFKHLGAEDYGTWALINAVLAVSGVASLGLGEAATKFVALHNTRNDIPRVIKVIQSILTLYLGLGFLAGSVIWFSAPWLVEHAFKTTLDHQVFAINSLKIAAVGLVVRFGYGVLEATVRGYHRYDLESMWSVFNSVVSTLVAVVCVATGHGLNAVLAGGIIVLIVGTFGLANVAHRLVGRWHFLWLSLDRESMREVFGFGVFTWFQALNGIVLHQLDRIIIGASLGAAAVGYYAVCLQLVQTAHSVLSRACAFLFPLIVKYYEQGRVDELWNIFKRTMIITSIIGWFISGGIFTFGADFLTVWMGADFAHKATETLEILSIWNACLATTVVQYYFLNATGGERLNALFGFVSSALFVAGAFFFIPHFGASGAAMARLFAVSSALITRTIFFRRIFGERRWFACLLPFMPIFVPAILMYLVSRYPWPAFKIHLVAITIGFGLSCLICYGISWAVYEKLFKAPKNQYGAGI